MIAALSRPFMGTTLTVGGALATFVAAPVVWLIVAILLAVVPA